MKLLGILLVAGGVYWWWSYQHQQELSALVDEGAAAFKKQTGKWPWQMGFPMRGPGAKAGSGGGIDSSRSL